MSTIPWLEDIDYRFPPLEHALTDPDGLLAAGGTLDPELLLTAYRKGIFPWYSEGQPILWWSPDPRCVLYPEKLEVSRSLRKSINNRDYVIRVDTAFREVMMECAAPRKEGAGTWITSNMLQSYSRLHDMGCAHSIECWRGSTLAGGLYGINIGRVFFGESMFSRERDASKVALAWLCERIRPDIIDVQVYSRHMQSLGAEMIPRQVFVRHLEQSCPLPALRFEDPGAGA